MKPAVALVQHALTLIAGIVLTIVALPYFAPQGTSDTPVSSAPTAMPDRVVPITLSEQEAAFGDLYEQIAPSVVSVNLGIRFDDEVLYTTLSGGSGFVIDAQGHIATNAHVIQLPQELLDYMDNEDIELQDTRYEVRMFDGTIVPAELVGSDPDSDLAVLKVEADSNRLHPVRFADSDNLRVGQFVVAIGNPFSNDWTLTSGIISALNRSIRGLQGFSIGGVIQTDTAINPGNSGGPLINLQGEVIGVNSQINSESGANTGIGFAVPSNLVKKVAESLITQGTVEYSFIGFVSLPVNLDIMNAFDLPDNLRGVVVRQLFEDTPAANAGLHAISDHSVDVITAIDGNPVADFDELIGYLAIHTLPGDTVTLTVYRDGDYLQMPVTLTHRPTNDVAAEVTEEATQAADTE